MRSGSWVGRLSRRRAAVLLAAVLPCPPALALQLVEARDGVAVEAILSTKEATRIRIEDAPILDVVGNVQAGGCATGGVTGSLAPLTPMTPITPITPPAGEHLAEAIVECDRERGEIYIRPYPGSSKPVNLFVSSPHATYTLILRRADTPADTIVLRDRSVRAAASDSGRAGTAAGHVRSLKAMLVAMAQEAAPADVRVEPLNQVVILWQEARFTLVARYESRTLVGEKYLLQNVSAQTMVLAEQEFDRPDAAASGQVLAVALDRQVLQPLESTQVYVIRRGGDR